MGIEYNVLVQEYEKIFYRNKDQINRQLSLQQRKEGNTNWVTVNKQFVKKDLENPW